MVKKRNKKFGGGRKSQEKKFIDISDFMQKDYPLTFILGA